MTAKFSKGFYDKLGHEVVDELVNHLNQVDATYRSELKELNELNFARFDDKLERRVTQLEAKIDWSTAQLGEALERRMGQAERRVLRWTFAFWAPTMLSLVSLVIAIFLKL